MSNTTSQSGSNSSELSINIKQLEKLQEKGLITINEEKLPKKISSKSIEVVQTESSRSRFSDTIEYVKSLKFRNILPELTDDRKLSLKICALIIGGSQILTIPVAIILGQLGHPKTNSGNLAMMLTMGFLALLIQAAGFAFHITESSESPYGCDSYNGRANTPKISYLLKALLIHGAAWALNLIIFGSGQLKRMISNNF